MELKKAIDRVAKVCPRSKDMEAYQAVRFVNGGPPFLYATDGLRFAMAKVDCEALPNMLLPSGPLVTAAKDPGNLEINEVGYGRIELRSETSVYQLKEMDPSRFPVLPPMPSQFTLMEDWIWGEVTKVFHAAGKEKEHPELAVVRFTPEYVEATDQARLARVEVDGPWEGLVPVSTFKTWPKGPIQVAFTTTHAFFWIGDEMRAAALAHNSAYPKTATVVPKHHEGPFVLVETQVFRDAVRQGMALSELGLVLVEMGETVPGLKIRAWCDQHTERGYEADVLVLHGRVAEPGVAQGTMLLVGKYLDEALQKIDTPNVKLGYGAISDPLRLESGVFVACVWQMSYS